MSAKTEDQLDALPDAQLLAMPGEAIPAGRLTAFFTKRAELLRQGEWDEMVLERSGGTVWHFVTFADNDPKARFMSDEQYDKLRDELPAELKALFVTAYITGLRRGEITAIQWPQVDFEAGLISLEWGETKTGEPRSVPILDGDMRELLLAAKKQHDEKWPGSPWVFSRDGERILDFRWAWDEACKRAGVPGLHFHDLRRTAVRNMRRAGIPQVIRMKISGHKTDSMERRYNIVDADDLQMAKELLQNRRKVANDNAETVTTTVTTAGKSAIPGDTARLRKSGT